MDVVGEARTEKGASSPLRRHQRVISDISVQTLFFDQMVRMRCGKSAIAPGNAHAQWIGVAV